MDLPSGNKKVEYYKMKDGENSLRFFGEVIARYGYWVKTADGHTIFVENLQFDREKAKFLNKETDWVPKYYPGLKSSWAYVVMGLDLSANKVVPVPLKKALFDGMKALAKDLYAEDATLNPEDRSPTNAVGGIDYIFTKTKTGPSAFNVEYKLKDRKCKIRALTEEELEMIAEADKIEDLCPRLTADEIKALLERSLKRKDEDNDTLPKEFEESVDDIPM